MNKRFLIVVSVYLVLIFAAYFAYKIIIVGDRVKTQEALKAEEKNQILANTGSNSAYEIGRAHV